MKAYIKEPELIDLSKNISILFKKDFIRRDLIKNTKNQIGYLEYSIEKIKGKIENLSNNEDELKGVSSFGFEYHSFHREENNEYPNAFFLLFLIEKYPTLKEKIIEFSKSDEAISFKELIYFEQQGLFNISLNSTPDVWGDSRYKIELEIAQLDELMLYQNVSKRFNNKLLKLLTEFSLKKINSIDSPLIKEFLAWFKEYKDLEKNEDYKELVTKKDELEKEEKALTVKKDELKKIYEKYLEKKKKKRGPFTI